MELRWSGLRLQMPTLSLQDVIAGLSIAGLLLPEAVAYSSIGNLPPQAGVLALFAGLLCYGLLGSSRFAIVSATSSSAAVMAAATASLANGDPQHRMALAFGLIILSGIFFVLASLAKIGSVSEFVAKPVLRGLPLHWHSRLPSNSFLKSSTSIRRKLIFCITSLILAHKLPGGI